LEVFRGQARRLRLCFGSTPLHPNQIPTPEPTRATKAALERTLATCAGPVAAGWCREVLHYLPLIERVMTQTKRRVFDGEPVPAKEKLVSLFEPHADIIFKGGRAMQYQAGLACIYTGCAAP
jgi:IS5 family transposase